MSESERRTVLDGNDECRTGSTPDDTVNDNCDFGVHEVFAYIIATFLSLVEKGGVHEGVAGLYRIASVLPAAHEEFPTAMAAIEEWLEGRNDGAGSCGQT